jgi:hypothetical protein
MVMVGVQLMAVIKPIDIRIIYPHTQLTINTGIPDVFP